MNWRSFWKSPHKFVEEFFRADLEVEGISAILYANVEKLIEIFSHCHMGTP
jgi:hypothetical protein